MSSRLHTVSTPHGDVPVTVTESGAVSDGTSTTGLPMATAGARSAMEPSSGRDGGAITAATFLGKFTQGLKWAHLDIAGTAYQSGAAKGSTGRPTALLADFLLKRATR